MARVGEMSIYQPDSKAIREVGVLEAHDFVVIHLGDGVMPGEVFGIFLDLLAGSQGDGLVGLCGIDGDQAILPGLGECLEVGGGGGGGAAQGSQEGFAFASPGSGNDAGPLGNGKLSSNRVGYGRSRGISRRQLYKVCKPAFFRPGLEGAALDRPTTVQPRLRAVLAALNVSSVVPE
jgi:hypothetical protein